MRILLLVQNYFPNKQSCARIMHDLATELRDLGHEVILVAPDHGLEVRRTISREHGFTVLRIRSGRFRGVPLAVRAFNEWRLSARLWNGAYDFFRENPCELIVTYSPPVFFGPLIKQLKRAWNSTTYLLLRDIFPKWSVDAGVIREGSLVHRIFRHYELLIYGTADVIGVQSERNLDYFREQGLANRYRLEVLYNWAPTRGQEVAKTQIRQDLGLEDRVVFLYGGNLGVAQDAFCIVRLADALRNEPKAFFLILGEGSEAERLIKAAEDRGLDNIRFLPPVDLKTYHGMVSESDVGLITLKRDLRTHNFPGKMLDYMYFSKPILAAVNPGNDLRDLLEEHEAGLVCWNGDERKFYEDSLRVARDADLRQRLGRHGRAVLERLFSPRRAARQILASAFASRPEGTNTSHGSRPAD